MGYLETTLGSGPMLAAREPMPWGTRRGRYILLERVGVGGMAEVYAAFDPELDRKVALKLVHRAVDHDEQEARNQLLGEAQAMARLSHHSVVKIHDFGTVDGQVFIAMEFIEGSSLRRWIIDEERPCADVLRAFATAGRGLAAAHAAGLVHRDFKPDNVLVADDGRILVTDFGLARAVEGPEMLDSGQEIDTVVTTTTDDERTDPLVGTPAYMAPEQLRGIRGGAAGDQFSFCVALFEALFGERPFEGRTIGELRETIEAGRIRVVDRGHDVPRSIRRALRRGLSADPHDRFRDMPALLAALAQRRTRWRRRAVYLAPVAIAAMGLYSWTSTPAGAPYCARVAHQLDGVWDPARAQAVRAAFDATGARYAADVFETVQADLTGYAQKWTQSQTAVCEAQKNVGQTQLARPMYCLHARREALRAVADYLGEADEATVRHAVDIVHGLADPKGCEVGGGPTLDLRQGLQTPQFEAELTSARAMEIAGRGDAARKRSESVRAAARAQGLRAVEARATLILADAHRADGTFDEADRLYHEAMAAALASDAPDVIVLACKSLALSAQERDHEPAEAQRWIAHALAALERVGDDSGMDATIASAQGRLAYLRGEYPRALEHYRQAQELRAQTVDRTDVRLAAHRINVANVLASLGNNLDAANEMLQALALQQRAYGPYHPAVGETLRGVGMNWVRAGKVEEGTPYIERAVAVFEASKGPNHMRTADALLTLSMAYTTGGRLHESRAPLERALGIYRQVHGDSHRKIAMVLNNLAGHEYDLGEFDKAEAHYRQGHEMLVERLGPRHPLTVTTAGNLAEAMLRGDRYDEARALLDPIVDGLKDPLEPWAAWPVEVRAWVDVQRGTPHRGIPLLERVLETRLAADQPVKRARTQLVLGAAMTAVRKDPARARQLVADAYDGLPDADRRRLDELVGRLLK